MKKILLLLLFFGIIDSAKSQKKFTLADTLRGSITPERAWWDLVHYHLKVKVDIENKSIAGSNQITFKVLDNPQAMQIDLQTPLTIDSAIFNHKKVSFRKIAPFVYHFIFEEKLRINQNYFIQIFYSGKPQIANNPPWDGGFSWRKDKNNNPFIATSCQGLGASVWWPCKDHMYDEVDSMDIEITCPTHLTAVSNGRLINVKNLSNGQKTFHWEVKNPINNYGVNLNIGDYVNWSEKYAGENGPLECNYYVLKNDLEKAKTQFKQVPQMLKAFEHWFGPYPFYEDSYKLVQVPYLGMEHQSSVTYGNQFKNGYLGEDLSGSGVGLLWDFIIIHESGHEWFANNITYKDMADMWIHESFTSYSETLFTEYYFGKEKALTYLKGTRKAIGNREKMISAYGVNSEPPGDIYFKGANMIHTLRTWLNDDEKFRQILRQMNKQFYHKTVTTAEIESFFDTNIPGNQKPFFDQYLRTTNVPILEYQWKKKALNYRWINTVDHFEMPLKINIKDTIVDLSPSNNWKTIQCKRKGIIQIDPNSYVFAIHKQ